MAVLDRIRQAWNAFRSSESPEVGPFVNTYGTSSSYLPNRPRPSYANEKTIISAIYTRIGIDVASIDIRHVKVDEQNRYVEDMNSKLNTALTIKPNLDQVPRHFRQDVVLTMLHCGVAAIVPVDTTINPMIDPIFDTISLRVGKVVHWYPHHVRVSLYNENTGKQEEIILDKRYVSIIENPLYNVMNEQNSTLQRLINKLSLLDVVDNASSSGKLDLIIQLPYVVKSEIRANQAEARLQALTDQLKDSAYGVAYIDGTEKVTQLNRPAENNLMKQVEFLTTMLYGQLGLTEEVMNGTADEKTMINYYNRTIEPILSSIVEAMTIALLGPPSVRKREKIKFFREPFKFTTAADLAEITDKFTRNEVLSSNEIRSYMGIPPSKDPKADLLQNSNMPQPVAPSAADVSSNGLATPSTNGNGSADAVSKVFDDIDSTLNEMFSELEGDLNG